MIVNLYVDHLMARPPTSPEDVWNATREHARLFTDAANRIGLTPGEYQEFRNALLDGKAVYVRLPKRMDAMSGARHGSVYAVRNAVMNESVLGWSVALANGSTVYVPQVCGNISLLRHTAVAVAKPRPPARLAAAKSPYRYTQAMGAVPKAAAGVPTVAVAPVAVPVEVTPPLEVAAPFAAAAPTLAAVVPAAAAGSAHGFLYFIPVAIGGLIAGISHSGSNTPAAPVPSCAQGSNGLNACQVASGFLRR